MNKTRADTIREIGPEGQRVAVKVGFRDAILSGIPKKSATQPPLGLVTDEAVDAQEGEQLTIFEEA